MVPVNWLGSPLDFRDCGQRHWRDWLCLWNLVRTLASRCGFPGSQRNACSPFCRCVVATGAPMNGLLLGPIACLIFPAVLLNFHVLVKIALVARKRLLSFSFLSFNYVLFLAQIFIEVDVAPSFWIPPLPGCKNGKQFGHNESSSSKINCIEQ